MCSKDQDLFLSSLEEKNDPIERFIQALNECPITAPFRALLSKHYSQGSHSELGSPDTIVKGLRASLAYPNLPEQIIAFVQTVEGTGLGIFPVGRNDFFAKKKPASLGFVRDLAETIFASSPEKLHQCFAGFKSCGFEYFLVTFAPQFYGEDFYLKPDFFKNHFAQYDSAERESSLWQLFQYLHNGGGQFGDFHYLVIEIFRHQGIDGSQDLKLGEQYLKKSFRFLNNWLLVESQRGTAAESSSLLHKFSDFLFDQSSALRSGSSCTAEDGTQIDLSSVKSWAENLLSAARKELEVIWCLNVRLDDMDDDQKKHFDYLYYEYNQHYLPLAPNQDANRIQKIIARSVAEEAKLLQEAKKTELLGSVNTHSDLWYASTYRPLWLKEWREVLASSAIEVQDSLLQKKFGYRIVLAIHEPSADIVLPSVDADSYEEDEYGITIRMRVEEEDQRWWDDSYRCLPERDEFTSDLLLPWVSVACSRLYMDETLVALVDKGFGLLRKFVSQGADLSSLDLKSAWLYLERLAPEKAFRHRLMLLRAASTPCAKKNLEIDQESACPWTARKILDDLLYAHQVQIRSTNDEPEFREAKRQEFLNQSRTWFAKYCLSRLKLRKGEKATKEGYRSDQVMESSSLWRRSYLKALSELGVDLKGDVHKTIFFIKDNDPDEEVRAIAKECYKVVRREYHEAQSEQDIRRGIVAAYWWLLYAQRRNLKEEVDQVEAVQVRRQQLRRS